MSSASCPPAIHKAVRSVLDAYQLCRVQIEKGSLLPLQAVLRDHAAVLGGHDRRLIDLALDWLVSGKYLSRSWKPVGNELVLPDGRTEFFGPVSMEAVLTPTAGLWALAESWPSAESQHAAVEKAAEQPEAAPQAQQAPENRATNAPQSQGGDTTVPTGFLGGQELAKALGVPEKQHGSFLRALGRLRKPAAGKPAQLADTDWQEVQNIRQNAAKFLYRLDAPAVQQLAERFTKTVGQKRPTTVRREKIMQRKVLPEQHFSVGQMSDE
jgi:hypothetical protein